MSAVAQTAAKVQVVAASAESGPDFVTEPQRKPAVKSSTTRTAPLPAQDGYTAELIFFIGK